MKMNEAPNKMGTEHPELDQIHIPDEPKVDLNIPNADDQYVTDMNQSFAMKRKLYVHVLAPQLEKNEKLKRDLKIRLMTNIFRILKWQFIATYVFVGLMTISLIFSAYLKIPESLVEAGISFMKFYITSIIVELISILFFIVKNVFDTSIIDLFKNFDKYKEKRETPDSLE